MPDAIQGLTPEARERLALKGRLLYRKSCGTGGRGVCAESFALYHIWRGEGDVARDLLAHLQEEIESLRDHDPDHRRAMAEGLAARIRRHLEGEGLQPPAPSEWAEILKRKKLRP